MTVDKDMSPPLLSPITTQCAKDNALEIHSLVPSLIDLEFNLNSNVNQLKNHITKNFTHLHPEKHNIFSPNTVNSKPVDEMFLSSHSLHQLLEDDSKVRFTEELYDSFVDVLTFHGEYLPSKQQRGDKLPDILFCKTQDTK